MTWTQARQAFETEAYQRIPNGATWMRRIVRR